MVLEQPTEAEKKRFDALQRQGLLPSEALKKLETERRLGITPEEPIKKYPLGITKENWWFYLTSGILLTGYLYFRFKSSPSTQSVSTQSISTNQLNEKYSDDIEYIDIYSSEYDVEYY